MLTGLSGRLLDCYTEFINSVDNVGLNNTSETC